MEMLDRKHTEPATPRMPQEIMDEITALEAESAEVLAGIRGML
jgi:hypothetical protein